MVELHFFVERRTEQTFADIVLKPHLAKFKVYMPKPILIANSEKSGMMYRGGGINFEAMQKDINLRLKQGTGKNVFFTTMIDLYDLPKKFPGYREAERLRNDPYKRVEAIEMSWFHKTEDPRFIPFIQLHEFEAYLLTDVSRFASFFENANFGIAALRKVVDGVQSPEEINDGPHTAPSKRIIGQFPGYEYEKKMVGSQMAEAIGLERIRSRCPHFGEWLHRLEKLAGPVQAG